MKCTDCGGRLVSAFIPIKTDHVRCTRCGHVFPVIVEMEETP